ncbi:hypothetical protein HQ576_04040 [bacterium]|nr:hypothetical protein [bacterium]
MPPKYKPPRLSRAPVYTTGTNPTIADFLARRVPRGAATAHDVPHDIVGTKQSAAYRMHSYHTKVPPEGIVPFLQRHTRPGDVVLDPFCGSGMTGVAARQSGRRAVLVDLSPAATFIAYHYCASLDPAQFRREAAQVLEAARAELEPLYATRCRSCGGEASLRFAVWSDRLKCPDCGHSFALWDVARGERRVKGQIACPACPRTGPRGSWPTLAPQLILVKYTCPQCGMLEAPATPGDARLAKAAARGDWTERIAFPTDPIPTRGDEIARVHRHGIARVDQLFTPRNLRAVATLWHTIATLPGLLCRSALFLALTGTMPRASRTNKYIPALGIAPGPILGTMYIPGFHPEVNVLSLFERKARAVARYHDQQRTPGPQADDAVRVSTQSATDLSNLPDRSIDYVFTDPPFGSNIAYSELNLLWESWLGVRTHVPSEAIVSRTHRKDIATYQQMMADAFREVRRVLKPRGRASIVFHNASADVWQALQGALDAAGLVVEDAVLFDKGPNQSFKQFTTQGAVTHDLVVTCKQGQAQSAARMATEEEVAGFLHGALGELTGKKKPDPQKLYSATIAHFLVRGERVPLGFADFRRVLKELA